MTEEQVLAELKAAFQVPSGHDICIQALDSVLGDRANDSEWIKANFSSLIERTQITAYDLYLAAERPAASSAIRTALADRLPQEPTVDDFFQLIEANFHALDRFFLVV